MSAGRKFSIIALVVVLVAAALLMMMPGSIHWAQGDTAEGSSSSPVTPAGEKSAVREDKEQAPESPERKRERFLGLLKAASEPRINAAELIRLIAEIEEAGLLFDKEVDRIYRSVIYAFSAEDLAKMALAWPVKGDRNSRYGGQFDAITGVLRERNDPQQFLTVFRALPADHIFRPQMIFKAAQRMSMFGPDELKTYLGQLRPSDYEGLVGGLVARITNSTPVVEDRLDLIQKYLDLGLDPALSGPLLKSHFQLTARNDPMPALEWVKTLDPQVAKQVDDPILRSLVAEHREQAAEYLNGIIAAGDVERSQKALESMANEWAQLDPVATLAWVDSLPDSVPKTEQMVFDAFAALKKADPKKAEEMMKGEKNPKRKETLERFWKLIE